MVVLTSPNYYGIATDVQGIAAAHERDVPVYVDEAGAASGPSSTMPLTVRHA